MHIVLDLVLQYNIDNTGDDDDDDDEYASSEVESTTATHISDCMFTKEQYFLFLS